MKKEYNVLQGNMTSTGMGDLNIITTFETLKEAVEYMNYIYKNLTGYAKYPNGYLETCVCDEENNMLDGITFKY